VKLRVILEAFVIKIGSAGLMFAMFVALTRALGPEQYGIYSAIFGCSTFMAFVAVSGQNNVVLRTVSALQDADNLGQSHWYLRRSFLTVLAGIAVVVAASFGLQAAFGGPGSAYSNGFFLWAALLVPPLALAEYLMSLLRGRGKVWTALLPRDILWRLGVILLVWGGAYALSIPFTATSAQVATAASLAVLILWQMAFAWRDLQGDVLQAPPKPDTANWKRSSFWNWVNAVAGMLVAQLSAVVILGAAGPTEAGAFFAADRISMLLSLTLISVNMVAAPQFARLHQLGDQKTLQQTCRKLAILLIIPVVVGNALILYLGGFLLGLFDPAFTIALGALALLLAGQTFNALSGSTGYLMMMSGGERQLAILLAVSQSVGLFLIWLLTLNYGITGGAVGALIGNAGWNLAAVVWCRRNLGVDPSIVGIFWQPPLRAMQPSSAPLEGDT
jgi:O-antigen/teichoic acid export membrane protein